MVSLAAFLYLRPYFLTPHHYDHLLLWSRVNVICRCQTRLASISSLLSLFLPFSSLVFSILPFLPSCFFFLYVCPGLLSEWFASSQMALASFPDGLPPSQVACFLPEWPVSFPSSLDHWRELVPVCAGNTYETRPLARAGPYMSWPIPDKTRPRASWSPYVLVTGSWGVGGLSVGLVAGGLGAVSCELGLGVGSKKKQLRLWHKWEG